jgi:cytochrome b involved in lipid metabolism
MKYIVLAIFLPLILTACLKTPVSDNGDNTTDTQVKNEAVSNGNLTEVNNQPSGEVKQSEYDLTEIAKHNKAEDCWLLINDKIYDVTEYIAGAKHPGGAAILEGCGQANGTELFATRPMGSGTPHPDKAYEYLENFYIANLKK